MFEEFFGSESFDVVAGVDMAIEFEKRSVDYYEEKSKKMRSDSVAHLLRYIAKEESGHLEQLEALRSSLSSKKGWIGAGGLGKPGVQKLYKKGEEPRISEDSGDVGILLAAARSETESKEFYLEFSRKVEDKAGKKFFERLAEFEQTHYDLFDAMLGASQVKVEGADLL